MLLTQDDIKRYAGIRKDSAQITYASSADFYMGIHRAEHVGGIHE